MIIYFLLSVFLIVAGFIIPESWILTCIGGLLLFLILANLITGSRES